MIATIPDLRARAEAYREARINAAQSEDLSQKRRRLRLAIKLADDLALAALGQR